LLLFAGKSNSLSFNWNVFEESFSADESCQPSETSFETLPCKDDCVARIEEEERLSVRIYDIGQSRDSRCQYKFNEDASIEDKDFISHSAAQRLIHGT